MKLEQYIGKSLIEVASFKTDAGTSTLPKHEIFKQVIDKICIKLEKHTGLLEGKKIAELGESWWQEVEKMPDSKEKRALQKSCCKIVYLSRQFSSARVKVSFQGKEMELPPAVLHAVALESSSLKKKLAKGQDLQFPVTEGAFQALLQWITEGKCKGMMSADLSLTANAMGIVRIDELEDLAIQKIRSCGLKDFAEVGRTTITALKAGESELITACFEYYIVMALMYSVPNKDLIEEFIKEIESIEHPLKDLFVLAAKGFESCKNEIEFKDQGYEVHLLKIARLIFKKNYKEACEVISQISVESDVIKSLKICFEGHKEGQVDQRLAKLDALPVNMFNKWINAMILKSLTRYEESLVLVNEIQKEDPAYLISYFTKGDIYEKQGQLQKAYDEYSQILQYCGTSDFRCNRVTVAMKACQYELAISDLKLMLQEKPNEKKYREYLSLAYLKLSQAAEPEYFAKQIRVQAPISVNSETESSIEAYKQELTTITEYNGELEKKLKAAEARVQKLEQVKRTLAQQVSAISKEQKPTIEALQDRIRELTQSHQAGTKRLAVTKKGKQRKRARTEKT